MRDFMEFLGAAVVALTIVGTLLACVGLGISAVVNRWLPMIGTDPLGIFAGAIGGWLLWGVITGGIILFYMWRGDPRES